MNSDPFNIFISGTQDVETWKKNSFQSWDYRLTVISASRGYPYKSLISPQSKIFGFKDIQKCHNGLLSLTALHSTDPKHHWPNLLSHVVRLSLFLFFAFTMNPSFSSYLILSSSALVLPFVFFFICFFYSFLLFIHSHLSTCVSLHVYPSLSLPSVPVPLPESRRSWIASIKVWWPRSRRWTVSSEHSSFWRTTTSWRSSVQDTALLYVTST